MGSDALITGLALDDGQLYSLATIAEYTPQDIIDAAQAELCRRSFAEFVRAAWDLVDPTPLIWSWHFDAICEHLQAVTEGKIKRLLINIAPGHAKSMLVSVLWPAWEWTRNPTLSYLSCSYEQGLTLRDSSKSRELIESDWYKERFWYAPGIANTDWRMASDQNVKSYFKNTRMGYRLCLTVAGKGTGYRANRIIVDDANKAKDVDNPDALARSVTWWKTTMHSRLNDPLQDAKVVIGQRLGEGDLPGHIIEEGGYEVLKLQSRYVAKPKRVFKSSIGFTDPRKADGEPLFPALYPKSVLDEAESARGMGAMAFAAQHQQEPVPAGGAVIKLKWTSNRWHFPNYKPVILPGTEQQLRAIDPYKQRWDALGLSLDCAFKDIKTSDRVALGVWGLLKPNIFLLDAKAGQMGVVETIACVNDTLAKWSRANAGQGLRFKLIEDKANGSAVIEVFRKRVSGIIPIEPQGSKFARISATTPEWEGGNVWLPIGMEWVDEYITELTGFPRMRWDDHVDQTSQAINYLAINPAGDAFRKLTSA